MSIYPISYLRQACIDFRQEKEQKLPNARAHFFFCCEQYYRQAAQDEKNADLYASAMRNDNMLKNAKKDFDEIFTIKTFNDRTLCEKLKDSSIQLQEKWKDVKQIINDDDCPDWKLERGIRELIQKNAQFGVKYLSASKKLGKDGKSGGSLTFPHTLMFCYRVLFEKWILDPAHLQQDLQPFEVCSEALFASIPYLAILQILSDPNENAEKLELFTAIKDKIPSWREDYNKLSESATDLSLLWNASPLSDSQQELSLDLPPSVQELFKEIHAGIYACRDADPVAFRGFFAVFLQNIPIRIQVAKKWAAYPELQALCTHVESSDGFSEQFQQLQLDEQAIKQSRRIHVEEIYDFLKHLSSEDYTTFRSCGGFSCYPDRQQDLQLSHLTNTRHFDSIKDIIALARSLQIRGLYTACD